MRALPVVTLPDCSGIAVPTLGGSTADYLRGLVIHGIGARALGLIERALDGAAPGPRRCLTSIREGLAALPAHGVIAAFEPPVSHAQFAPRWLHRDVTRRALGTARFLIGAPDVPSLAVVLPVEAFGDNGALYLPHLHAILDSAGGPVAVHADSGTIAFVWLDGLTLTVPARRLAGLPLGASRLQPLPTAGDWSILNGLPEVMGPPLDLSPQPDAAPGAEAFALLAAGLELLRETWPEAWNACRRFYRAVLIQPRPDDYTTSLTFDLLQGTFVASIHDPVQVADALCHEGSHTRLALLWAVDPLIDDDGAAIHPSPWRRDPRPLKGLLDGVHAFANVCLFYERLIAAFPGIEGAERILAEQRTKVLSAWSYFRERAVPTAVGGMLLQDLDVIVKGLR